MPATTASTTSVHAPELKLDEYFAEFDLDVRVTTDAAVGYTVRGCDTSNGCAATCASSCASN